MNKVQVALVILIVAGVAFVTPRAQPSLAAAAQQQQRTVDPSGAAVSALVAEVRALRADLADASFRSFRSQLLLGRLQMQEQRLAHLDRQRSEVTAKLLQQQTVSAGIAGQIERFTDGCGESPEQRRECEFMRADFKRQLATQQSLEQQLRTQESDLINAVAQEQARWSDFNTRLDDLERTLPRR